MHFHEADGLQCRDKIWWVQAGVHDCELSEWSRCFLLPGTTNHTMGTVIKTGM